MRKSLTNRRRPSKLGVWKKIGLTKTDCRAGVVPVADAIAPTERTTKMTDNIDDQYDEAMKLFGGTIPKIGEPTEYIKDLNEKYGHIPLPILNEDYAKALIEKYGHTELHSTVDEDMDDFGPGPTTEQLEEEHRAMQEVPDEELDYLDYYSRHGFTRDAPGCTDSDCPCGEN